MTLKTRSSGRLHQPGSPEMGDTDRPLLLRRGPDQADAERNLGADPGASYPVLAVANRRCP